jgi:hypothetical protein
MLRIQIFAPLIGSTYFGVLSTCCQNKHPPPTSHEIVTAFVNGVVL